MNISIKFKKDEIIKVLSDYLSKKGFETNGEPSIIYETFYSGYGVNETSTKKLDYIEFQGIFKGSSPLGE